MTDRQTNPKTVEQSDGSARRLQRPCSAAFRRAVHGRLNTISKKINELHAMMRTRFPGAYLYFEADGTIYALEELVSCDASLQRRQAVIIEKSDGFTRYDCGGW